MTIGGESSVVFGKSGDNATETSDFVIPTRDRAIIHQPAEALLCEPCKRLNLTFFDPNCPGCFAVMKDPHTTIGHVFAIIRQWVPQTQRNIDLLGREVMRRGAHPDDRDGLTDMTLLQYSAKAGCPGIGNTEAACNLAQHLIDKKCNLSFKCRWTQMSALHYAAYFDNAAMIRLLLQASKFDDVDTRCSDFDDGTSLHISASQNNYDAAKALLNLGADPNAQNKNNQTPLDVIPELPEDDEDGLLRARLRSMLTDAQFQLPKYDTPTYEGVCGKVLLMQLGFRLGERVIVGDSKHGTLRYMGTTEFASGLWAGVELDDTDGKNDGSVTNVAYFRCPPKHGLFCPVSKVSHEDGKKMAPKKASKSYSAKPLVDYSKVKSKVSAVNAIANAPAKKRSSLEKGDSHTEPGTPNSERETRRDLSRRPSEDSQSVDSESSKKQPVSKSRPENLDLSALKSRRNGPVTLDSPRSGTLTPTSAAAKTLMKRAMSPVGSRSSTPRSGGSGTIPGTPTSQATPRSEDDYDYTEELSKMEFQEGDRVLVSGKRQGVVKYRGVANFAPGVWYGVELDQPVGKNDGSVHGKRYFTCKQTHGVFAPPARISKATDDTKSRLTGSMEQLSSLKVKASGLKQRSSSVSNLAKTDVPPHKTTKQNPREPKLSVGSLVTVNNELGVIRFVGSTLFADGSWVGVELDTANGKNDGSVKDKRYFTCAPNHGILVRPAKVIPL